MISKSSGWPKKAQINFSLFACKYHAIYLRIILMTNGYQFSVAKHRTCNWASRLQKSNPFLKPVPINTMQLSFFLLLLLSLPELASSDCSSSRCATSSFGSCDSCLAGDWMDDVGINECCSCAGGKFQGSADYDGATCGSCVAGRWSSASASACTLCGTGRFGTATSATSSSYCYACLAGEIVFIS